MSITLFAVDFQMKTISTRYFQLIYPFHGLIWIQDEAMRKERCAAFVCKVMSVANEPNIGSVAHRCYPKSVLFFSFHSSYYFFIIYLVVYMKTRNFHCCLYHFGVRNGAGEHLVNSKNVCLVFQFAGYCWWQWYVWQFILVHFALERIWLLVWFYHGKLKWASIYK